MPTRRRRARPRFSLSRSEALRYLLVAVLVLALGTLTVVVSGAAILRGPRPDLALQFRAVDARATAQLAERLSVSPRGSAQRTESSAARQLAEAALRRDPTVAAAWRILAISSLDPQRSERLFRFASSVSRRDLPTQLWLIEERVQANDIPGALRHYDSALRTSAAGGEFLLPILADASADDTILPHLAELLRSSPPWRYRYLETLTRRIPDADNYVRLNQVIGPPASDEEREVRVAGIRRLVELNRFGSAWRLYRLLAGPAATPQQLLRNGDFELPNMFPAFDWQLESGAQLGSEQARAERGQGQALRAYAASGMGGVVASQLLMLPPGTYEVSAAAGRVDGSEPARLAWQLVCAGGDGQAFSEGDIPSLGQPTRSRLRFSVPPSGCPAQWLQLVVKSDFGPGGVGGWVDSVSVRRGDGRS